MTELKDLLDTLHSKGMDAFFDKFEPRKVIHSNGYTISEIEDEKWGRLFIIEELNKAWLTLDLAMKDTLELPRRRW